MSGRGPYQHRMPMHVAEAGHQDAAASRNDLSIGSPIGWDLVCRDALNDAPSNEDIRRSRKGWVLPVKDSDILEDSDPGSLLRPRRFERLG